jgi:FixJ family two-component response regulator
VGPKAADIGAVGHLAKPFELNDLLEMVRKALKEGPKTPPGPK